MPIGLLLFAALLALGCFGIAAWVWATADSTIIVVIRHAERAAGAPGAGDPGLSAAGQARAELLARLFGDGAAPGHLDAIYTSAALRNRETAAPLAARLGLSPTVVRSEGRELAREVLREHRGQRILVVGHADTLPDLVAALSGAKAVPAVGADDYGTLYVVTVPRIGRADVLRLNY